MEGGKKGTLYECRESFFETSDKHSDGSFHGKPSMNASASLLLSLFSNVF
jgi:hypothetical protein